MAYPLIIYNNYMSNAYCPMPIAIWDYKMANNAIISVFFKIMAWQGKV